jgi:glycosyltransferase involved in cell wall biosynthesis
MTVGEPRVLLVSPVRNEARHIEQDAAGLARQTRPPDLWVVVDDESTDGTSEILDRLEGELPWLRVVRTPPGFTVDSGDRNEAGGPDRAFNFGLDHANWREFTHLGKLDGDIVLPPDYLEAMLAHFAAEPELGIVGGGVHERDPAGGEWVLMRTPADHATPQARLYTRECFAAIGGFPPLMGADVITVMRAKMRGFTTRTYFELKLEHLRPMATADGVRRGRMRQGTYQYIVHYGPVWMLLRSFVVALRFHPRGLSGVWFFWGYLKAAFGPTKRVDDPELRRFMHAEQRGRILSVLRRGGPPAAGSRLERALEAARTIEAHAHRSDWIGPDPYEGMNATRLVGPLKRTALGRRVLLQLVKRSPVDLRPLLGIGPTPNAAALAFAVSAYAHGGFLEPAEEERRLQAVVERLLAERAPGFDEPCWGYRFATQSRVFFYDRFEPSTVATTFAAMALLDAHERLGDPRLLEVADGAARFFLRHVPQTEDAPGAYFGYLVGDRSPIHNSNLHACAVMARLSTLLDRPEYREAARAGVEWTLARQRPDGSWPYGERDNLAWVDNFHTGYVLDSLRVCDQAGIHEGIAEAYARGLDYFRRELFLVDGTPKYYANETHPIDGQCVAQAIGTLALAAETEPGCLHDAGRTLDWALKHFRRRDGLFFFQRRRFWTNRIAHLRWVQAPMLVALTQLIAAERTRSGASAASEPAAARARG